MRYFLFLAAFCISTLVHSQSTVRQNSYTKSNISYDSDPENINVKRLENLKGDIAELKTWVYEINERGAERINSASSFQYDFNADGQIEKEWRYDEQARPVETISYESFLNNRIGRKERIEEGEVVYSKAFQYDEWNRCMAYVINNNGQETRFEIEVTTEDSLDVFHMDGLEYKYIQDRIKIIEAPGSDVKEIFDYRNDKTLKRTGTNKYIKDMPNGGKLYNWLVGVKFSHKGWPLGFWTNNYGNNGDWISNLSTSYIYNDNRQVIKKVVNKSLFTINPWKQDSTIFNYNYNDQQLLLSIVKNENEKYPMVTIEYNEYDDVIKSISPAGEITYTYQEYDEVGNWLIREKYSNSKLVAREERVIRYY